MQSENLLKYSSNQLDKNSIKTYRRRWFILLIYIYYSAANSFQWFEYAIINNIIMKYYNVTALTVDATSIIYNASYAPFLLPASYIIDKMGLRVAALIGCFGTALGAVIKILSLNRNGFWVVLVGQAISSSMQPFILSLPPRIAAVWFPSHEVSTACALGVFGTQLGCAFGFLLPSILVHNHENVDDIGYELGIMCWGLGVIMIPVCLAVIFFFPKQPLIPPSVTQMEERRQQLEKPYSYNVFILSLKKLFKNKPFVVHLLAYGINVAIFSAISTLLNQFVLHYFLNAEEDAGRMGLLMIIMGIIGLVVFGMFLDKTHKYKETTCGVYLFSSISVVLVMFSLESKSKVFTYISMGIFGFFTSAYMPVGLEFATELTFPSPESTTSGLLMASTQILGVVSIIVLGEFNKSLGPFWALCTQASTLLFGAMITCFIPNLNKRQEAFKSQSHLRSTSIELQIFKI